MDHAIEPSTNGHGGHEHREANLKVIVWSAVGLAAATLIIMGFVIGMFNVLQNFEERRQLRLSPIAPPSMLPSGPRLPACTEMAQGNCVVQPYAEVQELRAHEDDVLTHYGWQDQKNGLVHIPIDKAMDIVLQKGPNGGKITPPASAKPGTRPPGTGPQGAAR